MEFYFYELRVIELERELAKARRDINKLRRLAAFNPDVDWNVIKPQLELIKALARLIREETLFFSKLGENYDQLQCVRILMDIIERHDPALKNQVAVEFQRIWSSEEEKKKRYEELRKRNKRIF